MRITALQPQANNPDRVNVFVDEHFLLGANALIVLRLGLRIGQELLPVQLEELQREEALQQAIDRAMNYLSFRPRSREEVRLYLRRKETPLELIDAVLERLQQLDLINDRAFAEFWVGTREKFSPRGTRLLKNELRMKGVERTIADEMLDDQQDEERAMRAGRKKALTLIRLARMDYATFSQRLGSFLQRRGFSYEVTKRSVKMLWEELRDENVDADDY